MSDTTPPVHHSAKTNIENTPLTSLFDALPGFSYCLQIAPTYRLTYLSRNVLAVLGYQKEELMTENFIVQDFIFKVIHPEDLDIFDHKLKRAQQAGKGNLQIAEYRIFSRSGTLKWVKDQFTGVWNTEGKMVSIEGYIHEVPHPTLRSQLLNQLTAYRDAIDVNMISSITDPSGIITYVNKTFCTVSQYTEDELIGQSHSIINSGHHPKSFFKDLWKTIASGKRWHGEIVNRAKDGSLYWVDSVIIPVFDESKRIISYLSLRMLITDRKKAEQQKDKHIKMLEEIAYLVAHRVRGPVCSILGLSHIMASTSNQEPEQLRKAIEYLTKSAKDLEEFTHQLSEKIYSSEVELRIEEFREKIKKTTK